MKKILLIISLIIPIITYSQRVIPRGGSVGQSLTIGSDGVNLTWEEITAGLPLPPYYPRGIDGTGIEFEIFADTVVFIADNKMSLYAPKLISLTSDSAILVNAEIETHVSDFYYWQNPPFTSNDTFTYLDLRTESFSIGTLASFINVSGNKDDSTLVVYGPKVSLGRDVGRLGFYGSYGTVKQSGATTVQQFSNQLTSLGLIGTNTITSSGGITNDSLVLPIVNGLLGLNLYSIKPNKDSAYIVITPENGSLESTIASNYTKPYLVLGKPQKSASIFGHQTGVGSDSVFDIDAPRINLRSTTVNEFGNGYTFPIIHGDTVLVKISDFIGIESNRIGITGDVEVDIAGPNVYVNGDTNTFTSLKHNFVQGNVSIMTAGKGFNIAEGSNARMGSGVLVGGTLTISNTSVTANTRILALGTLDGGVVGWLRSPSRVVGTSFTITSSSNLDTSTFTWVLFEPAN